MPYLELQAVHKRFGSAVALNDLTFALESGEFFSLLGPSGCGKTTALRIVAGFDQPDDGKVLLDGVPINEVPSRKRDMGVVFQSYNLFPNMTVQQNIEYGLRVRRRQKSARAEKAAQLLELVGLPELGRRYPHQLSGGQQQRVAVARALAVEPRVLLMDEPLSALDSQIRLQLREALRDIQVRLGTTVLYVTHDQDEALSVSDRVAVMQQGGVEQVGTPSEIYDAPRTRFVAEFVGAMNRIEAHVVDGASGEVRHNDAVLRLHAARGLPDGAPVLILIRPEALTVAPLSGSGAEPGPGRCTAAARVIAHAFLGPVTRLKARADQLGTLSADVPSAKMQGLAVGARVSVSFSTADVRVMSLTA
ncbi:ABC transporter ATP-binding protein [Streptomyces sp. NPDC007095]|jgi:putative spermidine/putrescine transport system ATP-binding protein|uniref:ABC transporter ATP-binding protein n=1 Tax=Streptomyces sp. NPDC007095 TaxID=3154482 RepID=UPI000C6FCFC0